MVKLFIWIAAIILVSTPAAPEGATRTAPASVYLAFEWQRDASRGVVAARTSIQNKSGVPVENVAFACTHTNSKGDVLGKIERATTGIIGVEASKTIGDIATGFVVEDGTRISCVVTDYSVVRQDIGPSTPVQRATTTRPAPKQPAAAASPQFVQAPPAMDVGDTGPTGMACVQSARTWVPIAIEPRMATARWSHALNPRFERGRRVVDFDLYNITFEVPNGDGDEVEFKYACRATENGSVQIMGRWHWPPPRP